MSNPAEKDTVCPSDETLRRVIEARASAQEEAAVAGHLTACPGCRRRLDELRLPGSTETFLPPSDFSLEGLEDDLRAVKERCLSLGTHPEVRGDRVEFPNGLRLPLPRDKRFLARLGSFDVVSVCGRGGMGVVLKAFEEPLDRYVALKVMHPSLAHDEASQARFRREARSAGRLKHPNIVTVHAVSREEDLPFIVMEYVRGKPLSAVIAAEESLDPRRAARIIGGILAGLDHAHRAGIIHRDVKPSNVLLEGPAETVKLADFGLARGVADAMRCTLDGSVLGTPWYMAPEQASGEERLDARSDLFSAGVVLFEMLAGVVPFPGQDPHQVVERLRTESAPDPRELRASIPPGLAAIVNRALRRDPAERFRSAAEFADAVAQWLAGEGASLRGPSSGCGPVAFQPAASDARPGTPEARFRVALEVTDGPQAGRRFDFQQHATLMVGRGSAVQCRIAGDPYFSRHHFMVEVSPPQCFLRDLGSLNGTYVNGQRVRQTHLKDGDVIHGGATRIRVHVESPRARHEEARAPQAPPRRSTTATRARPAVGMETLPVGEAPGRVPPAGLRCQLCRREARHSLLDELKDLSIVRFVCEECCPKPRDPRHPVPDYEVLEVVGNGSLGPVYKARRVSSGAVLTLKLLPPHMTSDSRAVTLFLRQMRIGATLQHPNIIPIVEMGQAGEDLWLATEFVEGTDAATLANRLGAPLCDADAVRIVCQFLEALDYAHGLNLVHRDVKPSSILVSGGPGAYRARLSDFGLIRSIEEAGLSGITRAGECRGTVAFMPPEQVIDSRSIQPAGDLYAAGATLYWLLSRQFVYDFEARDSRGEIKDPFLVILEDPLVPIRRRNPAVAPRLAQATETALARRPENRFASAAEMARALQAAIA